MRIAVAAFVVSVSAAACSPYQLPDPPAVEDRGEVALNPAVEQRLSAERFSEARRTVLSLYEALEAERWDDAAALLSNETRLLLSEGGTADATAALAAQEVTLNGVRYGFDPVDLFLLEGPESFEDDWQQEEQAETGRRKEIFIVAGEEFRRVVLIHEGDAWLVHMRRWPTDRLTSEPVSGRGDDADPTSSEGG